MLTFTLQGQQLPFGPLFAREIEMRRCGLFSRWALVLTVFVVVACVALDSAQAVYADEVTPPLYAAKEMARSAGVIRMQPGGAVTIWIDFKNTGTATWKNKGEHFIAMNVSAPTGRASDYRHAFWKLWYRPAVLAQDEVKPGEIGRFRFALQAPNFDAHSSERFALVAENHSFLEGGEFAIEFVVGDPRPAYAAEVVDQSAVSLILMPGENKQVWVEYKNIGANAWANDGERFIALNVIDPVGRVSAFRDVSTWTEYDYRPARLGNSAVTKDGIGRVVFTVKAPETPGTYEESFALVAENFAWLSGSEVTIPITVLDREEVVAAGGPRLRVGLYSAEEPIELRASGATSLRDDDGDLLAVAKETPVTLSFADYAYEANVDGTVVTSATPLRLVGDSATVITITGFDRRPSWNTSINYNTFRDSIELRRNADDTATWVINELPIEYYLRGLAEAGNTSPPEYHKALITAARTYALYHITKGTKHANERFHVDDDYDQVYRGYAYEQAVPAMTVAATATAGDIVAYNGKLAITPYFSHSDGITRSWQDVWNVKTGEYFPWLQAVEDPCCTTLTLYGHGVGMSAQGAIYFADQGYAYDEILAHYYTNITLAKDYAFNGIADSEPMLVEIAGGR